MKPYKVHLNDMLELTEGPYEGVVYKYGRVELVDEGEYLRVKFEYNVLDGQVDEQFEDYAGDILVELIEEGVVKNSIVYTGGTG